MTTIQLSEQSFLIGLLGLGILTLMLVNFKQVKNLVKTKWKFLLNSALMISIPVMLLRLVHSYHETPIFQNFGPSPHGCALVLVGVGIIALIFLIIGFISS